MTTALGDWWQVNMGDWWLVNMGDWWKVNMGDWWQVNTIPKMYQVDDFTRISLTLWSYRYLCTTKKI